MKYNNFLTEIAKLLEVNQSDLHADFKLKQCANWDSLTVVSVIALLDTLFGINISIKKIETIETIKQLLALTNEKETNRSALEDENLYAN